nr:MAG TPA: hypothetical protein [Caudoviricetes sp.]
MGLSSFMTACCNYVVFVNSWMRPVRPPGLPAEASSIVAPLLRPRVASGPARGPRKKPPARQVLSLAQ